MRLENFEFAAFIIQILLNQQLSFDDAATQFLRVYCHEPAQKFAPGGLVFP